MIAACGTPPSGSPAPEAAPPAPAEQVSPTEIELTASCGNEQAGYSLRYPAGWHSHQGEVVAPCSLFDPQPFEVPRNSEVPYEIAIHVGTETAPFETLAGEMVGRTVLQREETTVAGRSAARIETESTGEGLLDRGVRSYEYVVDLGDETLVAATYDLGTPSFEEKRRVLDAMISTLELAAGEQARNPLP